jgi:predicted HTH transcriptional regulator
MLNLNELSQYRENNRIEAKKASGGLPQSMWETYSAFANTNGGYILLGVEELPDGTLKAAGLDNMEKVIADFWNTVNNSQKVSVNILRDKNVQAAEYDGVKIIVIEVPRAERTDKPVYLNDDLWSAYRRNGEGDYHCSKANIKAMLRDAANQTQDMIALEKTPFSAFDYDTVKGYRNVMRATRPSHVWENLDDDDFLVKLGATGRGADEKLHPTAAGLLMFGFEHEIVREYPQYFLDYQECFDEALRWTDRISSTSGEWSGNLFGFFYKAYNKLVQNPGIKVPFIMDGITRVDDTPVHKALREALANCLINADYYGDGGVVVKNRIGMITFENPGSLRIRVEEAISGGFSNPRNSVLMKMFNLLDIGERAGSGIPNIFHVWEAQGWKAPVLEERFSPDRTVLSLTLPPQSGDKVAIKSGDKTKTAISKQKKQVIIDYLTGHPACKSKELSDLLGVNASRTKVYLRALIADGVVIAEGANRNRTYRLKG